MEGRFRKPLCNKQHQTGEAQSISGLRLKSFLNGSLQRWDDYYKCLSLDDASISSASLPSNLFHIFPEEMKPWISYQPVSNKKGRRKQQQQSQQQPVIETSNSSSEATIIDLGCGLGNDTLLNIVERQQLSYEEHQIDQSTPSAQPKLNAHFLDASNEAIQRLRRESRYQYATSVEGDEKDTAATITSQVFNLATEHSAIPSELDESANIILLLFTLSAIGPYHPHKSNQPQYSSLVNAVKNATSMLKPGGVILFRDYGRYDYDQLQLNSVVGAQLCDNFYARGLDDTNSSQGDDHSTTNGTGCYFFAIDEVKSLFTNAGLEVLQLDYITRVYKNKSDGTSRKRIWVQGRFSKPLR